MTAETRGWIAEISRWPVHEYWREVVEAWLDSPPLPPQVWRRLWTEVQRDPVDRWRYVHSGRELAAFCALSEVVPVYRGCAPDNQEGISWTTDPQMAITFAGSDGIVVGAVQRREVLAYLTRRGEHEIIALPEHVHGRRYAADVRAPITLYDAVEHMTLGVWDELSHQVFTQGYCASLALALHHTTGWQLVFFDFPTHAAIEMPDGRLLDADGVSDYAQAAERWGKVSTHVSADELVETYEDACSPEGMQDVHAEQFAASLLATHVRAPFAQ